jgi:MipA family protein
MTPPPALTYFGVTAASLLSASMCLMLPVEAHAQEGMVGGDGPMTGSSEIMLGLGVANGPAYLGSDARKTRALPLIAARWSNGWFAGTSGIGYRFDTGTPLSAGLRLGFDPGRDEDDAAALRGMGDIQSRAEFGAFANYRLMPGLTAGTSVRYGSGNDRDGWLVDASLRGMVPLGESFRLTAGITATAANTMSMQSQFGVNAVQSANSGYAVYSPGSGLRDVNVQVGGMFMLRPNTTLMLGANARTLLGDAKDSPLTRERTGVGVMATVAFRL